jgi:hypothetical protein
MHEIALQYNGKKKPFQFDNPKTGKLKFTPGVATWVAVGAANWLMQVNPGMFTKVGERGVPEDEMVIIEDAADTIKNKAEADAEEKRQDETELPLTDAPPEEISTVAPFACPKCKKEYKDKRWYDQHVSKCEG